MKSKFNFSKRYSRRAEIKKKQYEKIISDIKQFAKMQVIHLILRLRNSAQIMTKTQDLMAVLAWTR